MLPLFESGIPLIKERLNSLSDADNITIAYPDEGAWKRFHAQLGEYPEVSHTATTSGLLLAIHSAKLVYVEMQNSLQEALSDCRMVYF